VRLCENFGNIEDANNIQPSLLFAISKPSAPEELQKAVLSGDITTNKEYQEALKAKAEAEQEAQRAIEEKKRAEFEAKEFERKYKARESTIESHKQALDEEKKRRYQLELDLRRAQEKGDSEEVKSLQLEIENYQSEIGSLNIKMQELKNQMKDKPIEVSALKVVEKLPDEIMDAIYKKVASLYETILNLTETEIQVFAQSVDPDQYDDIVQKISDAIGILNNIDTAVYETTKATLEAAATAEKKTTPCDDCQYGTRDGLRDEDEKNGMVNCTMYNTLVVNDRGCRNFAER
jgi:DNA repair exonuclease SbcCD ATPase subunit